jgi:sn-glycerol 3-phosphate transport system substrate-binding protein
MNNRIDSSRRARRHDPRRRPRSLRTGLVVTGLVLVTSACGGGGGSITDAGNKSTNAPTTPTTGSAAAPTTIATTPTSSAATGDGATASTTAPVTSPATTSTVAASTTTSTPLASLPKCDTTALAAQTSPVTITFWDALGGTQNPAALKALTAEYNASQTKVRINIEEQSAYQTAIDKYLQSPQDGRPDIVMTPEYAFTQIKDTKSVVPIDACAVSSKYDESPIIPSTLKEYSAGGVLYSMPFNVSNPVLYFNKRVFAAAGLDPAKPPLTLEELRADSDKIVASKAATYGLALDTGFDSGGGWYTEQWFAKAGDFYSDNDNGRSAPSTKVTFAGKTGVDLLTYMQKLVADKLAVNVGPNDSGQDTLLKMADAKQPAAMSINTSAAIANVLTVLKAGTIKGFAADDLGVGPMPGPSVQPGVNVGGASLWIVDHKNDAKAAAAWDYIQFLTSAKSQSTWANSTGYVPIRKDATDLDPLKTTYTTDPRFKVALDQLLATPDIPSSAGPALGPQRDVRKIVSDAMAAILKGADPQATLNDAATKSNALITQYAQALG